MYHYKRIRELREDSDLTQKELAKHLGIQTTTYRRYELGDRECPAHLIIKLCEFYKVSADYILGLPEDMPYPKR